MLAAAPRDLTHQRPRAALVLVALVLACHAAGALGALVTDAAWYRELARPSWAPPGWVFGPVWLTLYTMMGVAAWRVWRTPSGPARSRALGWFAAQLALNAAWTPVFFGLRSLGGGLVVSHRSSSTIGGVWCVLRHAGRLSFQANEIRQSCRRRARTHRDQADSRG